MPSQTLNSITSRIPSSLRNFRRSTSVSSSDSTFSSNRDSYMSNGSSIATIESIMQRQPSVVDMEEERKTFGSGLEILEPRPIVYWGGMEERMGSL